MGIREEYHDWMVSMVDSEHICRRYTKVLHTLDNRDFFSDIPIDSNRTEDGVDLRYRFGDEKGYPHPVIATELDAFSSCSLLEMMVALSIRMENMTEDPEDGNRTGKWFMGMIFSMGLDRYTDDKFNIADVDVIITNFNNHAYASNGKGGLFTLNHPPKDMRTVEIWYQMNWYLTAMYKEKNNGRI